MHPLWGCAKRGVCASVLLALPNQIYCASSGSIAHLRPAEDTGLELAGKCVVRLWVLLCRVISGVSLVLVAEQVFRLREENESLMESLVRAKVDAAEAQGEYLKMRRALLRSIEKQAGMASKIDEMRDAFRNGNTEGITGLLDAAKQARPQASFSGDIESLGERQVF